MSAAHTYVQPKLQQFLDRLEKVRRSDNGWSARCPAHDDRNPSLWITAREKRFFANCQAQCGCSEEAIMAAVGLTMDDVWYEPAKPKARKASEPDWTLKMLPTAKYDYHDASGKRIYQAWRFERTVHGEREKTFRPAYQDASGKWQRGNGGIPRVLYRLPQLLAADPSLPVYICEGEKDADRLAAAGLIATTNALGASNWDTVRDAPERLRGRHVVILEDNDQAGRERTQMLITSLQGKAASIRLVRFTDMPEHGDVSDWLDAGHTIDELEQLATAAPIPPDSVETATPEPPRPELRKVYRLTEQGNAERLLDAYGENIRYATALGFVIWDGKHWTQDPEGLTVYRWAQAIVSDMYREAGDLAQDAAAIGDPESDRAKQLAENAKALLSWAKQSARHQMYAHMREIIKPASGTDPNTFDAQPMLLSCANGTIDLATGQLREHRREDYLMRGSPFAYDPDMPTPVWNRFVSDVTCGRQELAAYLQRSLGYTITGDVSEQVWHLAVGGGENGKGTLMEAVGEILGDLTQEVEPEYITLGGRPPDPNAPSPVAASFKGKRLVKITETAEGARIDAAKVKKLSGGDTLTGRNLHKGVIRFTPTHKLWIYTNHRPETRETTHAFWRRVRYIPFDLKLDEHPGMKDRKLPDKLRDEYPGILAWLVRGCLAWQREGLNPPPIVLEATQQYKRDMQPLKDFLEERCVLSAEAWVPTAVLWQAYQEWGKEFNARRMLSKSEFTTVLKDTGCTDKSSRYQGKVVRGWLGIGLLSDSDPDPEDKQSVDTLTPVDGTFRKSPREKNNPSTKPESSVNGVNGVNKMPVS